MGRDTEFKLRKAYGTEKLNKFRDIVQKPVKPDVQKVLQKTEAVVTEETESHKVTVFLIVAFVVFGGLGVYFKFFNNTTDVSNNDKSITELFGEKPNSDDKMLQPRKLSINELQNYCWIDNPIALAEVFDVIAIIRESTPLVRIRINLPEFEGKRIPLRRAGDMLTDEYKIIDIKEPVIFLSDKEGKLHRLVDPNNWRSAASVYDWQKDLFQELDNITVEKSEGMTPEEAAITFGDYELVNPTEQQISLLRSWVDANPDYRFEDFSSQCSKLGIVYKMKLKTTMGGMMKPKSSDE